MEGFSGGSVNGAKKRRKSVGLLMMAVMPMAISAVPALAANLTWDAGGATPAAPVDGSGNWDATTALWSNGSTDSGWVSGSTAVFGSANGAAGNVTIDDPSGTVSVSGLTFNAAGSGNYTIAASGTNTLTLASPNVSVAAGVTATINAPLAGTQGLSLSGNGTLTLGTASPALTGDVFVAVGSTLKILGINDASATQAAAEAAWAAKGFPANTESIGPDSALGYDGPNTGNITIANGGTLSLAATAANNSINFGMKTVLIAGAGANGTGAVVNPTTGNREFTAFNFLTLTDNATISGSRIDIGRDGDPSNTIPDKLDLGGHTLTINMNLAAQPMFGIQAAGNAKGNNVGTIVTSGQIDVVKGALDIELNANLSNDGTSKITFEDNGAFGATGANIETFKTDGVSCTRPMVFKGHNLIGPGQASTASTLASNMTITGPIGFESVVSGNPGNNTANCSLTLSGNIVESGVASISLLGSSTTVLTGTNTWTGGTNFGFNGVLSLGSAGAFPTGTPINFGNAAGLGGTFDLGGFNATVSAITNTASGDTTSTIGNSSTTTPSTLTYAGNIATPGTFAGTIKDSITTIINVAGTSTPRVGTQTTGVTVSSGLLTLNGNNSYTGNTTVTGGELDVGASGTIASANIVVGAGGVFAVVSGGNIGTTANITNNGVVNLNNPTHTIGALNGTTAGAVVNLNTTNLTVSGGGSYAGAVNDGGANGTLTVAAPLSVGSFNVASVAVNANLQIHGTSKTSALALTGGTGAWTSGLDITTSKAILEATPASKATVLSQTQDQVNFGKTNTAGIFTSSSAGANFAIAVLDNAVLNKTSFGGVAVDANSVLIGQELLGDANADGHVDLTDLSTVLNNFGTATTAWTSGNFDGAATIDLTDLSAVLNNFGLSNGNASASAGAAIGAPEPGSLAMLGLGAAALIGRRRKM